MKKTYTDESGYKRVKVQHSNLIHRQNAYKYIYLKNKSRYPLKFSEYQVHHIDGNKSNNHSSNLQLVTKKKHEGIHETKKKKPGFMKRFFDEWNTMRW